MSTLRRNSFKGAQNGQAGTALAVLGGTHRGTQMTIKQAAYTAAGGRIMSEEGREHIAEAQRRRWKRYNKKKPHWMQLPKNRAKMMRQMRKMQKARSHNAGRDRDYAAEYRRRKGGKTSSPSSAMKGYWAKMTAQQRSKEIIRRRQVARKNIVQAALKQEKGATHVSAS
jgi:hypothetical protein